MPGQRRDFSSGERQHARDCDSACQTVRFRRGEQEGEVTRRFSLARCRNSSQMAVPFVLILSAVALLLPQSSGESACSSMMYGFSLWCLAQGFAGLQSQCFCFPLNMNTHPKHMKLGFVVQRKCSSRQSPNRNRTPTLLSLSLLMEVDSKQDISTSALLLASPPNVSGMLRNSLSQQLGTQAQISSHAKLTNGRILRRGRCLS